jgi:uncharacterized protein YabN with tetrapyrrole methylase and pyrophosphatase domain
MSKKECLLKKVEEQEIAAKDFGFYWENFEQLIEQVQSECKEVQEAFGNNDRVHLEEEVGDLIQAAIALAVFLEIDPHDALKKGIDKFQKRYDAVVEFAQEDGHKTLHEQPFEVLMHYWNRAKKK